jgi:hypothetical protein
LLHARNMPCMRLEYNADTVLPGVPSVQCTTLWSKCYPYRYLKTECNVAWCLRPQTFYISVSMSQVEPTLSY